MVAVRRCAHPSTTSTVARVSVELGPVCVGVKSYGAGHIGAVLSF